LRPRSITGPLILIAIGVLFLLHNLRPDLSLFSFFANYWPFLLIGAGVIGLIEVLFHASRGTAAPPRPISGGAVFWILILCLFAAFLNRHRTFDFRGFRGFNDGEITIFGSDYEYDVNAADFARVSTQGVTGIVLDNLRGDISIKGVDRDAVSVTGRKTIRAFNRSEADRRNQQTHVRLDREGDLLILRSDGPAGPIAGQISTDLDITVPRGVRVEKRTRDRVGDLMIDGIDGSVDVSGGRGDVHLNHIGNNVRIESTRGGDIRVENLKGDLDLTGRGGDVQLTNIAGLVTINGEFSGNLEFRALAAPLRFQSLRTQFSVEAIPGEITLDLGDLRMSNVVGPVRFTTGTRDVQAADVSNALELTVERGDIDIRASKNPPPKIDAHSRNGDITVTLPDNAAFQLSGSTQQGEVENEFGGALRTSSDGRRASVTGQTGNGPQITLTTNRGTVFVKKG
jgi:DUF4097 and DUF4098 domain-containing protein YvlB